jgi:tetratricopeptide (TPR) repeat protein
MEFLERALRLDPTFARAWAIVGSYRTLNYEYWGIGQYQQVRERAYAAARQALKLNPNLSDAHLALGQIHYILDWDVSAATLEFKRATELDPGNPDAFRTGSDVALSEGHADEAAALARNAIDRDPLYAFQLSDPGQRGACPR